MEGADIKRRLSIKLASPIYGGGGPRSGGRGCYIKGRPHSFTIYHLPFEYHSPREPPNARSGATQYADRSHLLFSAQYALESHTLPLCNKPQTPLLLQVNQNKAIHLNRLAPYRISHGSHPCIRWFLKQRHISLVFFLRLTLAEIPRFRVAILTRRCLAKFALR